MGLSRGLGLSLGLGSTYDWAPTILGLPPELDQLNESKQTLTSSSNWFPDFEKHFLIQRYKPKWLNRNLTSLCPKFDVEDPEQNFQPLRSTKVLNYAFSFFELIACNFLQVDMIWILHDWLVYGAKPHSRFRRLDNTHYIRLNRPYIVLIF